MYSKQVLLFGPNLDLYHTSLKVKRMQISGTKALTVPFLWHSFNRRNCIVWPILFILNVFTAHKKRLTFIIYLLNATMNDNPNESQILY